MTDVGRKLGTEVLAKRAAALRARAALIVRCPKGHEYDEANTHINKKGKRICLACARERMAAKLAVETPEQRERRMATNRAAYHKNKAARQAQMLQYRLAHKAEKSEYDRLRRERLKVG